LLLLATNTATGGRITTAAIATPVTMTTAAETVSAGMSSYVRCHVIRPCSHPALVAKYHYMPSRIY